MRRTRQRGRAKQRLLPFPRPKVERRGRPRCTRKGYVAHLPRPKLASRYPVHVTIRVAQGLPNLRRKGPYRVILRAFAAGCDRFGFRLNHFSVQANHIHLIVEAKDERALGRGLKGLCVRLARRLNSAWKRRGQLFPERYHAVILRTPNQVRNALAYVLRNWLHHRPKGAEAEAAGSAPSEPDFFSSGQVFDGWRDGPPPSPRERGDPVVAPRTWLQTTGWRLRGLIPLGSSISLQGA